MTETTNNPNLLKTLVCPKRQQHDLIPEEYQVHKKKLSIQFGLVSIEDNIFVHKNLRTTIFSLLHKEHPAINKMFLAARLFWRPKMMEAIQTKCETCIPCKMAGKSIKPNLPQTENNSLPPLSNPNEEIQLNYIGPTTQNNSRFYILLFIDQFSDWTAANDCTSADGETAVHFLEQYIRYTGNNSNGQSYRIHGTLFREFCKRQYTVNTHPNRPSKAGS